MRKLRITVGNKSYEVTVEDITEPGMPSGPVPVTTSVPVSAPASAPQASPRPQASGEAGAVTSPMAGVIKSVLVKQGDQVKQGEALLVLEAMKMENQITAPVAGTVKQVAVEPNASVQEGQTLVVLE